MNNSPQKPATMSSEPPEQLLDVFKAAALSVTRLYKTSAAAQAKARSDGYQDCLDDLLAFLDKENIGLGDGEGWKIRRWATERLVGRAQDGSQGMESEDDAEKADSDTSPELQRSMLAAGNYPAARTDSAPPASASHHSTAHARPALEGVSAATVPTQESFTFQSSVPYPQQQQQLQPHQQQHHPHQQEPIFNLANLDLSDSRVHDASGPQQSPPFSSVASIPAGARPSRLRHGSTASRTAPRATNRLGRGAGQKRRMPDDLGDIFNIGSLGYNGKDFFGGNGGAKRSRHT